MNRLWVVTGASRGIGRAVAQSLGSVERPLIVTATGLPQLDTLCGELRLRGCGVRPVALDLTRGDGVDELKRALEGREVAGLVNNAGVLVRKPLGDLTDADIERVLAINLAGVMRVTRACLPHLRPGSRVINIGSISGTVGTADASLYNATKWGLTGLTRSWAEEWRARGILVAEVRPGAVETEMLKQTPYPAQMSPEEVARTVRFLALEAPPSMTGSSVDMFG